MSGQPNIYPTDASVFRQQYLANLNLRAQIDDMNLQANKIYKKTGQTPSQPTDTRTTTEKLADVERLKIELMSELSEIADGQQSQEIVEALGDRELEFLAQHIKEIVTDIKPKYKYGIDALTFIAYLNRYIERADATDEVNFGLQQTTGQNILMSVNQIMGDMVTQPYMLAIRDQIRNHSTVINAQLRMALERKIDDLAAILPTQQDVVALFQNQDVNTRAQLQQRFDQLYRILPSTAEVTNIMRQFQQGVLANDSRRVTEVSEKLDALLALSPATRDQAEQIIRDLKEISGSSSSVGGAQAMAVAQPVVTADIKDNIDRIFRPTSSFDGSAKGPMIDYLVRMKGVGRFFNWKDIGLRGDPARVQYSNGALMEAVANLNGLIGRLETPQAVKVAGGQGKGLRKRIKIIKGNGIVEYRHKPIVNEIDYSAGVVAKNNYIPFGRLFADVHKLNDNIVRLRTKEGRGVPPFPNQRVSLGLGSVIRTIANNKAPSFDDMSKLSNEEKKYLHKLAKYGHLLDRLSIPSPSKDEDDKDIHQFEVMKGEILSGNDNMEYIRKFKLLLTKMVNNDLLPRNQAKEILIELAGLGY